MKDNYYVEMPVLMKVNVLIENVESEEEAIEKAINNFDVEKLKLKEGYYCEELSPYKRIVQGNYYLGHIEEATAEKE